jgi:hypothetical protein
MGTGRARDRMQAARDRHRKAPGQHAGTPCARRELSPHTHAGVEELHLLDGELWIDAPGRLQLRAPGADDERVWSETGCTCVLVTSTKDILR